MPFEYLMLTVMTLFFLFAWLPGSFGKKASYGMAWLLSNREPTGKELLPWAGRCERAYTNLKDYFPAFAVAVLLLGSLGKFDRCTQWAAGVYVVARALHFLLYALGNVRGRFLAYLAGLISNLVLLVKILL